LRPIISREMVQDRQSTDSQSCRKSVNFYRTALISNVITWVITSANLLPRRQGEFGNQDRLRVIVGEYPGPAQEQLSQFHDVVLLLFDSESL